MDTNRNEDGGHFSGHRILRTVQLLRSGLHPTLIHRFGEDSGPIIYAGLGSAGVEAHEYDYVAFLNPHDITSSGVAEAEMQHLQRICDEGGEPLYTRMKPPTPMDSWGYSSLRDAPPKIAVFRRSGARASPCPSVAIKGSKRFKHCPYALRDQLLRAMVGCESAADRFRLYWDGDPLTDPSDAQESQRGVDPGTTERPERPWTDVVTLMARYPSCSNRIVNGTAVSMYGEPERRIPNGEKPDLALFTTDNIMDALRRMKRTRVLKF